MRGGEPTSIGRSALVDNLFQEDLGRWTINPLRQGDKGKDEREREIGSGGYFS